MATFEKRICAFCNKNKSCFVSHFKDTGICGKCVADITVIVEEMGEAFDRALEREVKKLKS